MYARLKSSKRSKNSTLQIVKGVRSGTKVKQYVVASLGVVNDPKNLKRIFRMAESLIKKIQEQGFKIPEKVNLKTLTHKMTSYDGFGMVVDKLIRTCGFLLVLQNAHGKQRFNLEEAAKT